MTAQQDIVNTNWPAGLEVLGKAPTFVLDGGHNPLGAKAMEDALSLLFPDKKMVFIVGSFVDEGYAEMVKSIMPFAESVICVAPQSDRELQVDGLTGYLRELGVETRVCNDISEAVYEALHIAGSNGTVVAFGSICQAEEIRKKYSSVYRKWLRKSKISARDKFSEEERAEKSKKAVKRIMDSAEFEAAETIMIYRATRGELSLKELEKQAKGKKFVFPLCTSKTEMIALFPEKDAWQKGFCGIEEPILEQSEVISPEEIDMVICPCTVFDAKGGRVGMGAGFYDRYLPGCVNSHIVAVAFEDQKTPEVPVSSWDVPMHVVFTEDAVYRCRSENS